MLHPSPKLLGRRAHLHRVNRIPVLHHHSLEEVAAEHTIGGTEPLVECETINV